MLVAMNELAVEAQPERVVVPDVPPPPGTALSDAPSTGDAKPQDGAWLKLLKLKVNQQGKFVNEQIGMNAAVILENHPAWKGALRFNEVTKEVECIGGPLSEADRTPAQLLTAVENWLQKNEDLNLSSAVVAAEMLHVARRHSYDPLRDYLLGLKWDGVERLPTFLEQYCGAVTTLDVDGEPMDITNRVRMVGVKWFIAAVARALDPGCKADNVLVLEGPQGAGKSAMLRALGGRWFTDSPMVLNDKDSKMLASMSWIIELAELSAMRKVETEAQKAFFSACEDKLRPPYGRVVETFPRRCVFAGTTNETEYLPDATGNRRFWAAFCEKFDVEKAKRDRDLLWAEAVARYNRGEPHWCNAEESASLEVVANQRLRSSGLAETVMEWWTGMEPEKRPGFFTCNDVALEALGLPKHQADASYERIGRTCKKLGFERTRIAGV